MSPVPVASFTAMPSPSDPEAREAARSVLRRLVRYLASALDVRYAFVAAYRDPEGTLFGSLGLWLARDYGLRSEFAEVELSGRGEPGPRSLVAALRLAWGDEPHLIGVGDERVTSLGLFAPEGHLLGHLGILDPEGIGKASSADCLRPLARTAAAELRRWIAG